MNYCVCHHKKWWWRWLQRLEYNVVLYISITLPSFELLATQHVCALLHLWACLKASRAHFAYCCQALNSMPPSPIIVYLELLLYHLKNSSNLKSGTWLKQQQFGSILDGQKNSKTKLRRGNILFIQKRKKQVKAFLYNTSYVFFSH